jgi:pimeloyl-ACP methyl ester carboxylesterase
MSASEGYVTTTDGVRLFFRTTGMGSKTVLVPRGLYLAGEFAVLGDRCRLVFYDVRNSGKSDAITDPATLAGGIHRDVDDLDEVRRHFEVSEVALIGHSYVGLLVALYAMRHPDRVSRVVQIGPVPPDARTQYPAHLTNADGTLARVLARLAQLQQEPPSGTAEERCERFWAALREIYVADPADAEKIRWGRCDLPNERNFLKHWTAYIQPSFQRLSLGRDDFAALQAPVLIVHGRRDRSAPYGGALDWAASLPNARLVTVDNAAHAPWIEAPHVLGWIATFLDGTWPEAAARHSAEIA